MNTVGNWARDRLRAIAVPLVMLMATSGVQAGMLEVHVAAGGKDLADAVVTAVPRDVSGTAPRAPREHAVMLQQFQQFDPFVLPIQVGTTVEFPNRDAFRHHVYSFSPAKSFELKLYGGGEVQTVVFDKEGVVALGCNIHDNMLAYIDVVGTPYFSKSNGTGLGMVRDVPAGTYTVTAWHPDQKSGVPAQEIAIPASGTVHVEIAMTLKRDTRQRQPAAVDERAY